MCDEDEASGDAVIDNDATMKIAPGSPPWQIGSFRLATVGLESEDPGVSAEILRSRAITTWLKLQESHTAQVPPPPLPGASGGASHTSSDPSRSS